MGLLNNGNNISRRADQSEKKDSVSNLLESLPLHADAIHLSISLNSWTVYAIHLLSNLGIPATKETITVSLFKIYPAKWSLEGFAEYPDSDRVNRALLQLRPKYRNWAYGDSQLGWTLNDRGRQEAIRLEQILEKGGEIGSNPGLNKKVRPRTRAIDQNLKEIENSRLFRYFRDGDSDQSSHFDLWSCFGSSGLTPPRALEEMRQRLLRQSRTLENKQMEEFLQWVKIRFKGYFDT